MTISQFVSKFAIAKSRLWPWALFTSFASTVLIQIYDPFFKYKLNFPVSPWEQDGRVMFVNGFDKHVYWGRPIQGLLQWILPVSQNWFLINLISLIATPIICLLVISIAISPRKYPLYYLMTAIASMLLLRTTSGFVSSWAYTSVITNGLATFFGLLALLNLSRFSNPNRSFRLTAFSFGTFTLLSVLSKQDAIFGLALAGVLVSVLQVFSKQSSVIRDRHKILVPLFPLLVLVVETFRQRFSESFFTMNTGTYKRELNPRSILNSFLKYPGTDISRNVFFAALVLLLVLLILIIYRKKTEKKEIQGLHLVSTFRTCLIVIIFGIGLRFPYLILPYHQFDWYSNYWLLTDLAATALLAKTLFMCARPRIRIFTIFLGFVYLLSSLYLPNTPDLFPDDRKRVEGWFVQRVIENQNITEFLELNSQKLREFDCIKVINASFLTPWIFDSGSYLERLLGKKYRWIVETSEETYNFIQQFPEFEYQSSPSFAPNITIYESGKSPLELSCGVIRFTGDLSSGGLLVNGH